MKNPNQIPGKRPLSHVIILSLVMGFCLNINLANAQQSNSKAGNVIDQKAIKLTAAQLAMFAGKYKTMDDNGRDVYVTIISVKGGIILKQLQGRGESISFYPTDLYEFHTNHFGKAYWIRFGGKSKYKADSFVTIDNDIWVRVK
ncbi:hypothetical protein FO440_08005 [Mucilaginibacter corticis]|uniref:DUF3471 domain-containing protein n=1 Tax=Mucilaginibacter corticis TaxID=2597670 RepID=A0A556MVZ2_9SPHI|nr:hypothetical protein [Mucilaginibacter corticis]TSJ44106.1 hypothetical protein FO440_08005 [Mucilaginibacter corticis]